MTSRVSVHITRNFERNLESIRVFLSEMEEADRPQSFERLVDALFDSIIPNLERFPLLGIDFLARRPQSIEGAIKWKSLQARLGGDRSVREYIAGDYILLYAVSKTRIDLLAIKHHKQLSFDLRGHWQP